MPTPNGHKTGEAKTIISGIILASFAGLGLLLTDSAGGFGGYTLVFVHCVAWCCFIAGPFGVWFEMSNGSVSEKLKRISLWYIALCAAAGILCFLIWRPLPPEPTPHFVFTLRKLDAPEPVLFLTNNFLSDVIWTYGVSSQHDLWGMLIIPTEPGQSTITLRFGVDNDSEATAYDPDIVVTLPSDCGFSGGNDWKRVDGSRPEQQAWGYTEKTLRPHRGVNFDDIELSGVSHLFGTNESPTWMNIMIDPTNSKPQAISFGIAVWGNTIWKTNDLLKPIMVKLKPMPNGAKEMSLNPQELRRLQE